MAPIPTHPPTQPHPHISKHTHHPTYKQTHAYPTYTHCQLLLFLAYLMNWVTCSGKEQREARHM